MVNFMCQLGWITGAQIAGKTLSLDGMVRMFPMTLTFESVNWVKEIPSLTWRCEARPACWGPEEGWICPLSLSPCIYIYHWFCFFGGAWLVHTFRLNMFILRFSCEMLNLNSNLHMVYTESCVPDGIYMFEFEFDDKFSKLPYFSIRIKVLHGQHSRASMLKYPKPKL